jgi:hypothetical protein
MGEFGSALPLRFIDLRGRKLGVTTADVVDAVAAVGGTTEYRGKFPTVLC